MSEEYVHKNFWSLSESELGFARQYRGKNRLKIAALLKYFQNESRFPDKYDDISEIGRKTLSALFEVPDEIDPSYDYLDRTGKRLRRDVRAFLDFKIALPADLEKTKSDLIGACSKDINVENRLSELLKQWFQDKKIERPSALREERIINAVKSTLEEMCYQRVANDLNNDHKHALDALLKIQTDETSEVVLLCWTVLRQC